jgi:hypothetical protein
MRYCKELWIRLSDDPGGGMKAIFVAIATIALVGCTTYPNHELRKADLASFRPSCEEESPGNWPKIAHCVESQTRGFRDVQRFLEEHNIRNGDTTPEAKIFTKCSREWRNSHGHPDWSAIAFCVKTQWAGYRQLNP